MSDIKVFVSHRIDLDSVLVKNSIYTPVRCGAALDNCVHATIQGDNTGENISDKREYLGEFTVQYWAWKNIKADYYGICHYRRYLSFSDERYQTDEKSQVIEPYLSPDTVHKYRLDDPDHIASVVEQYDILVNEYADISKFYTPRGSRPTVYQHFSAYDHFLVDKEDIDLLLDTIDMLYPDIGKSAREYFNEKNFRGYNCFILKKDLFFQLCDMEVNVMRAIAQTNQIDFTNRSSLEKRTYGFFCEWMYGIFIYHLEKQKKYRIKQLQLVFFEKTERPTYIKPIPHTTTVAYLTNRYLLPVTQTSIQSLIDSKCETSAYDIIIAHEELTPKETEATVNFFSQYPNISVRFINFRSLVPTASNGLHWERTDNLSYVAGLLPWILKDFSRVIYLHSDTLIYTDLQQLYQRDLGSCCLAAPRDYLRICEAYKDRKIQTLRQEKLLLSDHNRYFSTSVLLMDLQKIRNQYSCDLLLRYAFGTYYFRDAMNRIFSDQTLLLEANWNVCAYANGQIVELSQFMPDRFALELKKAHQHPWVFHYPFYPKPWGNPYDSDSSRFWLIARRIPMYESLFTNMCHALIGTAQHKPSLSFQSTESFPRQISNIILPKGSIRREIAKKICPKDSVMWNFFKRVYYSIIKH